MTSRTRRKKRGRNYWGHGQIILVVDDEPTILAATQMILEKNNYCVLVANDGQEALATLVEHGAGIDVVLTDLSMPRMDGIAMVREIRKINPDSSLIVTTGEGDQNRLNELEALNIANFLSKPVSYSCRHRKPRLTPKLRFCASPQESLDRAHDVASQC
jgi:two-component system, cell cycle sensor histidine kinase and response regulator CckA